MAVAFGNYKEQLDYETTIKDGLGKAIHDLKQSLQSRRLSDSQKQLLSDEELFSFVVVQALGKIGGLFTNVETFIYYVLLEVEKLDEGLAAKIIEAWAERSRVDLTKNNIRSRMAALLIKNGLPVDASGLEKVLERIYQQILREGQLPQFVEKYLATQPAGFKGGSENGIVSQGMVDYLVETAVFKREGEQGFDSILSEIGKGEHDEHFGVAYREAKRRLAGGVDPIESLRTKGADAKWDYRVRRFDSIEEQGIIPDNIRRAGAIDTIYWMGEVMGIFKIVDAIVLAWGRGEVDLESAGSKLYRYIKLRDERSSEEERFGLYKRVLNRGEGSVLDRVVVNEQFPVLWHRLMKEVARFIAKSEVATGSIGQVSAAPILQAVGDLQYNLTDHSTGYADLQIKEINGHYEDAYDILTDPEILDQYAGGRRKNLWTVIERIARTEFQSSLNISAIRTVAEEGNFIFNWIADFKPADRNAGFRWAGTRTDSLADPLGLSDLVAAADRWLQAAEQLESVGVGVNQGPDVESVEDEMDDWEA